MRSRYLAVVALVLGLSLGSVAQAQKPDYAAAKKAYKKAQRAIEKGEWAIAAREFGVAYDITKDPLEWTNVAGNPENAPILKELQAKLKAWMDEQGDKGHQTELEAHLHQGRNRKKGGKGKKKKK